jgi:uncharacterized protein (TIGR02099 family)
MKQITIKQSLNTINLFFITTFLVLALYSALGQQVFPYIAQYRVDIQHYLSDQLNSDISIAALSGDMNMLTPSIHLEGVTMIDSENTSFPSLSIAAIDAVLDPRASLINLAPVFKQVRISGLSIRIPQTNLDNKKEDTDNSAVIQQIIEILLLQQNLELNNVTIEFEKEEGIEHFYLNNISMVGDGFNRLMTGNLTLGDKSQVKTGIRLYSEGSPYNLNEFYARGVLDLPKLSVDHWIENLADISIFDAFDASAQISFEFKQGLLNYAKLNLASTKVAIPSKGDFKNLSTELWLKQSNVDTWSVWLKNGDFSFHDKSWSLHDIGIKLSKTEKGNRWHSYIKHADIEYTYNLISDLGVMPKSVVNIYQELSPTGSLSNFNIILQQEHGPTQLKGRDPIKNQAPDVTVTLAGELNGVSTQAVDTIPGLHNISGVIAANKTSGRVQFEGQDMKLDFPTLYDNPFEILKGKGQVDWTLNEQGMQIIGNGIDAQLPGVSSLKGGFDLLVPKIESGKTGTIELNLSTAKTDVRAHPSLVPKVTPKSLNNWLVSALRGGDVNVGNFYFYDALGSENSDPVLELYLDTKNAELAYLKDWPSIKDISGKVLLENLDVYGKFTSATTLGGKLTNSQIVYAGGEEPNLWVNTQAAGLSSEMFSYFKVTPLKDVVNNIFNQWDLTGTQKTSLGLKIPMSGDATLLTADVSASLTDSNLMLNDIGISVDKINGPIRYTTNTGLTSPKLTGQVWGEKMTSNITTKMHGRHMSSDISFDGILNGSKFKNWLKLSLLEPMSGSSQASGHMLIDTRATGFTGLTFSSNLKGVTLNLPGKFNKGADEIRPLTGSLELKEGQILKLSYAERVNLAIRLNQGQLISGQVFVGQTEAYLPSEPGVVVDGHLASFNLNDWIDTWNTIQGSEYSASAGQASNPVRLLNVSTDLFQYNSFRFKHAKAVIRQLNNIWEFDIDAPVAKGQITLDGIKPIDINLDYVHWPMIAVSDPENDKADPLQAVDPNVFPLMDIDVDEIFLGPTNLGRWTLNVKPIENGAQFSKINGLVKKLSVKGDAEWLKWPAKVSTDVTGASPKESEIRQTTNVSLLLTSDDVAGIQKAWRVKPVIEAKYGKINTNLNWSGSPADPLISSISGKLDVNLKDGRFIEAGEAGSLSAFGLLNFSAIGRRLRLDFSDIYESGFHFDYVKGRTQINNGIVSVVDTLEIDGPSAKFESSGTVNLDTKVLNQELSATFPITGTLPLMAIIAGFAPPVAASLFVGERLVGDKIEEFTSATYQLTGTWDKPDLKLVKRFDNNIEGRQNKTFWHRMKSFFGLGDD